MTASRPGGVIGLSLANPGTALVHLGIADGNIDAESAEPEHERPE